METSSPLAAIRPSRGFGGDNFGSNAHLAQHAFGGGPMGLCNRFTFQRSTAQDSVRGSSPSVSLAADLSQNFQINDSSPRFPTPRRALFTSAALIDAMSRDYVASPSPAPMPMSVTSSPSFDMMDMTPLPQRGLVVEKSKMASPCPSDEEMTVDQSPLRKRSQEQLKPATAVRKMAALRRPSLSRAKVHSTSAMPSRPTGPAEKQLPPFRFSGESNPFEAKQTLTMAPSDCFQDSPIQDRRPSTANSPTPTWGRTHPKPQFGSLSGMTCARNGSPLNAHVRRPSNLFLRPRKQFRRSLSMFENPGDIIEPRKEVAGPSALQSVIDMDEPQEPLLPHFFPEGESDSIPRITRNTMLDVLDGKYVERFEQKMIVDCRFEYEYEGGHIDGAVNYNDKEIFASQLLNTPMNGSTLLIFHCEYSALRAPMMARHVRAADRHANIEQYPKLTYPEVYILDGGYSGFFNEHRDRCYPQAYIEMDHAEHVRTCERELGRLRQNRKAHARAQTYAFGQLDHSAHVSPTSPGRADNREQRSPGTMIGASPILSIDRAHARRMVSF